ncbi:ATP-dependent Clp protease adaptor ClpS [Marivirga harenae]|uniref:ATP-dependent Clp protease adaptor ClpS n=1 Tax=Marivirga harenae TaxID=2010992 RepID=UPI0026DFACA0|nr:ATP-dependent Clp protease adaptor ClpS [Marivirga harenae]WKV12743.1 ATP-dependent Clp protease adaptor ClpS [Marivirga harenae]|tara:strand:+ start:16587 stop:16883 length:297 start_codon:yes stop_codon:yes gene_type:complete
MNNFNIFYQYQEDTREEILESVSDEEVNDLIVYNDDINTFDHVINTLIKVCKHSPEQAEQCTLLVHYKGKCAVKKGSFVDLIPYRQGIVDAGINAEIE